MSDETKKPGPDPERLVIEDDPEEALDRLLGKSQDTGWVEFEDGREPHAMKPGLYDAFVEVGRRIRGIQPMVLKKSGGRWRGRQGGPLVDSDTIIRVRWISDLP